MRNHLKMSIVALLGFGGAATASAEVVCNEDGDCWRIKERYEYKPELKLRVYPNDWKWADNEKDRYRWRDAPSEKRGYWRQGVWVEISE